MEPYLHSPYAYKLCFNYTQNKLHRLGSDKTKMHVICSTILEQCLPQIWGRGGGGWVMPSTTSNDILLTNESGPFPRNYLNCHFQSGVFKPRPEVTFVRTATEEKRSTLRKSLSNYHLVHQYYSKYYQSITWDIFNICTY